VFESTARDFIAKSIENDSAFLHEFDPVKNPAAFEAAWKARSEGAVGEVHAFEPNYEGGTGKAAGRHTFEARAGHHLAPSQLSDGRNVYEVLGPGFALLALDADAASVSAFTAAAAHLGLHLQVIADTAQGERQRYAAGLVLVRPDQFVAWAGTGDVGLDAAMVVLQRARGAA
jgi:hypothetical protein